MPIDPRMVKWDEGTKIDPRMVKWEAAPPEDKAGPLGNIALGALKGASDIGRTLLYPLDAMGVTGRSPQERKASIADLMQENADQESLSFKGGELATDIAGTAGAGGMLAKGLRMIPGVASAAPKVLSAIETGGFKLGSPAAVTKLGQATNIGTRALGGAVTGGLSAGMIDPETIGVGSAIGAAVPGGVKVAGMFGRGAKSLAGTAVSKAIGLTTGAGDEALKTAFVSGKTANTEFLNNLRGKANMTDVLDDAKSALSQMRLARGAEYRSGMADLSKDKTVLDFTPIQSAVQSLKTMGSFKGQAINKNAAATVGEIEEQVANWQKLNPAEYHTPEGLDALKQAIGDIRDATQFGTPGRKAADTAYNAVKKQISDQAPEYSRVMRDYSEASELIGEIQKAFSLGEKSSKDTAMRKLQSLMRNNVNTNYGNRMNLVSALELKGGKELLPAIAGQALSSATPRGLQGLTAAASGIYGLSNPTFLASLPLQSPRLMGEAAYGLGRASGGTRNAANAIGQRASRIGGLLGDPDTYLPMMTAAPSIAFSR